MIREKAKATEARTMSKIRLPLILFFERAFFFGRGRRRNLQGNAAVFAESVLRFVDGVTGGADSLSVQAGSADLTIKFVGFHNAVACRTVFVKNLSAFYAELCGVFVFKGTLRANFHKILSLYID